MPSLEKSIETLISLGAREMGSRQRLPQVFGVAVVCRLNMLNLRHRNKETLNLRGPDRQPDLSLDGFPRPARGGLGYRFEGAVSPAITVMSITQEILLWPPPICPGIALFSLGFRAIFSAIVS
jgi:hypothetical protein